MPGRDPEDRTRQICNGWRADKVIAAQVLSERTGRLGAQLGRYRGTRILQDNVLWKPPGTKAIGFHQDSSYADYLVPAGDADVLDLAARDDGRRRADRVRPRLAPVAEVAAAAIAVPRAGGLARAGASGGAGGRGARRRARRRQARRRLLPPRPHLARVGAEHERERGADGARHAHAPVEARFHETNVDLIYSRYRRHGDLSLDESFFPVLWDESGYRTPWLAAAARRWT